MYYCHRSQFKLVFNSELYFSPALFSDSKTSLGAVAASFQDGAHDSPPGVHPLCRVLLLDARIDRCEPWNMAEAGVCHFRDSVIKDTAASVLLAFPSFSLSPTPVFLSLAHR